jgi:predicted class III extradiol MEMO1 family dioxygenase
VLLLLLLTRQLQMVRHCPQQFNIEFKCYDQSSKAVSSSDSSVSYAAAVMVAVEHHS